MLCMIVILWCMREKMYRRASLSRACCRVSTILTVRILGLGERILEDGIPVWVNKINLKNKSVTFQHTAVYPSTNKQWFKSRGNSRAYALNGKNKCKRAAEFISLGQIIKRKRQQVPSARLTLHSTQLCTQFKISWIKKKKYFWQ